MSDTATVAPQKMEFKTELKQLLDLIIHSLYTKKEIFLRELVSNAADAVDKVRFQSLTDSNLLEGNSDWKIKLIPDEASNTLTIRDNGIGMSRESIVENLGTIARSGTREFLANLQAANAQQRPELIGQFGVGFYASFMVADHVTVLSRMAGPVSDGVKWESDGQGEYTVEPYEKESRGTDVILHLREDAKEFLQIHRLRSIVQQYSNFIDHPIVADVEKETDGNKTTDEETLNSRKALWLRNKAEITAEEYNAFYKQVSRDFEDPLKTIHLAAEGQMEFRAVMFIPAHKPFDFFGPQPKAGLDLYVRRVLIMHECEELMPTYLRFVKGVVDSSDLPLNVSRETLQHNPLLARIRGNLVTRVLKTLDEMKTSEFDTYLKFYKEFGPVLKEGTGQDFANREKIADLLLFESTKTKPGEFTTLAKYLEGMTTEQKEILYLTGESREQIENSPYLESFKARGHEILLLTDPVDEYVVGSLNTYKEKPLKAVDRGNVDDSADDESKKAAQEKFKGLLAGLKDKLTEVKEVRLSSRLKESAACLVAEEHAMGAHMERLMQRMGRGQDIPPGARILELNPDHPTVEAMRVLHEKNAADPRLEDFGRLLYDEAVIAEGSKVKDPSAFSRRINDLIAKAAV